MLHLLFGAWYTAHLLLLGSRRHEHLRECTALLWEHVRGARGVDVGHMIYRRFPLKPSSDSIAWFGTERGGACRLLGCGSHYLSLRHYWLRSCAWLGSS